ncbi:hypothetical protein ACP4OV_007344 [Aristida adscensionis]
MQHRLEVGSHTPAKAARETRLPISFALLGSPTPWSYLSLTPLLSAAALAEPASSPPARGNCAAKLQADAKLPIRGGMQLRSGRRLAPPSPPPPPQGCARRRHTRRGPAGSDREEEDRFSVLPQEMLLEILGRVGRRRCAREASRTSVLSRRWRGLWTQLRELSFHGVHPDTLMDVLGHVRPELNRLEIWFSRDELEPAQISSLLRALNRLDPAELVVDLEKQHHTGPFELPFFQRAISIDLYDPRLRFTLPPAGNFASLEELKLGLVVFDIGALLPCCI